MFESILMGLVLTFKLISRAWFLPLNPFESSSPKMFDHLEARNGKKSHQNHFFLHNPSFSSHSLLLNTVCAQNEHCKTTFGLIYHFKCKVMFGLHKNFHFSFFSFLVFISLPFII